MPRTLAQLQADVAAWLDRGDLGARLAGWIAMCETDIGELLRARCMVVRASQPVNGNIIALPADFLEMESLRDNATGCALTLEDHFTGPPANKGGPVTAYRQVGECIEFLPHPTLPDPAPVGWTPQIVNMAYFAQPRPLADPQDTNAVLEKHYAVYLFGTLRHGANFQVDAPAKSGWETDFLAAVTAANSWKLAAQFSGAPLRAVTTAF